MTVAVASAPGSRVLGQWLAARPGAAERAGVQPISAAGENSVVTGLSIEQLMGVLGLASSTSAGVNVTADTAMRVATVYACVALIAGAIMTLPVAIYERDGIDRSRVGHDYWWFLNEQANEDMTSAAAWEYLISSKLFYGDGFAELIRPSVVSNRVVGFRPLHPLRVQPFTDSARRLYYRVTPANAPEYVLDPADVLHLPSLGFDGLRSPSPVTHAAREAIGVALAAERFSGRFFTEGATFDYALKTASDLNAAQIDALKTSLLARVGGNKRLPLILTGGLEPAQLSVNPKDAEILSTRLFSVEEICRVFGVPPHMVGHTDKTTSWGSGIEQQGIGFVRYTLMRHLVPIAQELNRKLWPTRARYFVEHITAALERGDLKARYEAHRIALGRAGEQPWTTVDEVRRLENMPPMPGLNRNEGNDDEPPADPTAR